MEFTVEFFGLPRRLSGVKETTVQVPAGATLRDVVKALAAKFPAFLGDLIDPNSYELESPYFFNVNARHVPRSLEYQPKEGERLLLLFVEAGG
nr:MoaD/ThiS family protein [Chloroflexota bacterium]